MIVSSNSHTLLDAPRSPRGSAYAGRGHGERGLAVGGRYTGRPAGPERGPLFAGALRRCRLDLLDGEWTQLAGRLAGSPCWHPAARSTV